ncbi:GSCOCG00011258001-RA-CDS, partial [Cotesia congregata]
MNLNEAATLGTLISGTGFTSLEEQLTDMNIPCMSHVTYRQCRDKIGKTIYNVSREEMKKAGQLELDLALKAGDIIKGRNGQPDRPFITVIVDGAWSKRSYKGGRYDALSGTAVIIGKRTGLVLRNKACTGCERNSKHNCVENWGRDQTSTSMETDIITEGFRNSIEMHELIYKYVVGDGDSSVYKSIIDNDPYAEENEKKAIEELEKKIKKKIIPCGLFIDKDIEFLGASPDGLIDTDGIIEIKCFASANNLTPNDAIKSIRHYGSIFKKSNINEMSTTHKYYYQVQ